VLGLPIGFGIGVNVGSRLVDHLGVRRQSVIGFLVIAASILWLARTPTHASFISTFLPGITGIGLGLGLALIPMITTVTTGVPPDDQGIVAGVYGMSQQMGGAIGLAVIASVAASGAATAAGEVVRSISEEAHAIRVAFTVTFGAALLAVVLAAITLPRWLAPAPHDALLPLTGVPETHALVDAVADDHAELG
jgi:MFS family permease